MPIAFDSVGTAQDSSNSGTISWNHNIISNTNGLILALFANDVTLSQSINASPKFAGQNLTKLISGTNTDNNLTYECWYLLNPPSGLGTFNGTWSASGITDKTGISLAYTGVNQITPIAGSAFFVGTIPTSGSVTRTLAANNWWVGGIYLDSPPGTTSIGNERGTAKSATNAFENIGADNTSGTLRWTFPTSDVVLLGAEIAAFVSVSGGGNTPSPASSLGLLGLLP